MGYYSHFFGEMPIEPPLAVEEIEDSEFYEPNQRVYGASYTSVIYRISEEKRKIDGLTYTRKIADAIVPLSDDEYKGYDFVNDMKKIVAEIRAKGSSTWGFIIREGSEPGDLERVGVELSTDPVISEQAKLVWPSSRNFGWPDGEEYRGRS